MASDFISQGTKVHYLMYYFYYLVGRYYHIIYVTQLFIKRGHCHSLIKYVSQGYSSMIQVKTQSLQNRTIQLQGSHGAKDTRYILRQTCVCNIYVKGQWLWLSWQSGRFRQQRSAVQTQSSAKFLLSIVNCQLCRKDKNKEKEAGNGPFSKKPSMLKRFPQASHLAYRMCIITNMY